MSRSAPEGDPEEQSLLSETGQDPEATLSSVDELLPEEIAALAEEKEEWADGEIEQQLPQNVEQDDTNAPSRHALYCSHFLSTWGQASVLPRWCHPMRHAACMAS
jgi:hypothetical protein